MKLLHAHFALPLFVPLAALMLPGCGGDETTDADPTPLPAATRCDTPTVPACMDQTIDLLGLKATTAAGLIENTAVDAGGFATEVDATAGGLTPTQAFVYGIFTDTGLTKRDLDDESAFTDMNWDIAFRRYVIRINGGDSGPSCVNVAILPQSASFDTVTTVSADLTPYVDEFMTASCALTNDGSGLENSPAVAMGGFWHRVDNSYGGCLQMTDRVFVLTLRNNRHVKLAVTHYYNIEPQTLCDTTPETFNAMGQGSGHIGVRWAFLD